MHSHRNGRGYRREARRWDDWQSDTPETKGACAAGSTPGPPDRPAGASRGRAAGGRPAEGVPGGAPRGDLADLEKRLSGVQHDFNQALQKSGEKENEKFDLIFSILVELQGRQAQLEESVRLLTARLGGAGGQLPGGAAGPAGAPQPPPGQQPPHGQFAGAGSGHQGFGQMNGQMGGQMNSQMAGHMNGQQAMQQFSGVMQPDASQAMFTAEPQQIVVVASPQYMPQMMSPTGAMQPMQMQYMGQGADMGGFVGNSTGTGNSALVAEQQQPPQQQTQPQPQPRNEQGPQPPQSPQSPQSPHRDAHVTAGDSQVQLPSPQQQQLVSPGQGQAQPPQSPSAAAQQLQSQHDGTSVGSNAMASCLQHGVVIQQPQQADHGGGGERA